MRVSVVFIAGVKRDSFALWLHFLVHHNWVGVHRFGRQRWLVVLLELKVRGRFQISRADQRVCRKREFHLNVATCIQWELAHTRTLPFHLDPGSLATLTLVQQILVLRGLAVQSSACL